VYLHLAEKHEHEHVHEPLFHEHRHVHDTHHRHRMRRPIRTANRTAIRISMAFSPTKPALSRPASPARARLSHVGRSQQAVIMLYRFRSHHDIAKPRREPFGGIEQPGIA
jgi:hypothetical protein